MNYNLLNLGWNEFHQSHFEVFEAQGFLPARVACEKKHLYTVYSENGELNAEVSGRFRFYTQTSRDFPVVGDWTAISTWEDDKIAIIHALLPRKTCFSRKTAWSKTEEQVLAANIDGVFLVSGMDREFDLRRIERYLTLCRNDNIQPVIVLNKSDLCPQIADKISEVESIAVDIPIHAMSALNNIGVDILKTYLKQGKTGVVLGSSGVGKSTIINRLMDQDRLSVGQISASTGKGKHITVHRELLLIPTGGLIIDTPGLRELQLWGDKEDLKGSFKDIELLAQQCRFRDCQHLSEPECAVKNAVEKGDLDMERYKNFLKMRREFAFLAARQKQRTYLSKQENRNKPGQKRKGFFRDPKEGQNDVI